MWWSLLLPLSAGALVSPSASPVVDLTRAPFVLSTRKPTRYPTAYPTRYPTSKTDAPAFPPVELISSDTTFLPSFSPSFTPPTTVFIPPTTDAPVFIPPTTDAPSSSPSPPPSTNSPTTPPLLVVNTPAPAMEPPKEAVVETPAPVAAASYAWFAVLVLPAICLGILIARKRRAERRQHQLVDSVAQIWTETKQFLVVV